MYTSTMLAKDTPSQQHAAHAPAGQRMICSSVALVHSIAVLKLGRTLIGGGGKIRWQVTDGNVPGGDAPRAG